MVELSTMPKYEAYKDSGEDWIDEVPEHWDVKKLKHIFIEKKHTQNLNLNCGSISFGKVITKDDEKIPHSTKASYQEVLNGEFLINPLNLNYDLISLRIGLSEIDVVVSAGYIVLKNKVDISKEYFKYLLHRYDVAYMKLLGSGVRQTINFNHIANSLLLQPPMTEQIAIAIFLNKKTRQIDEAIAIKEKQISLLKERKQLIIQQAVTQGLNPDAPMKDSGVEWIGDIPEHWTISKIGHYARVYNGSTPSRDVKRYWENGTIPWMSSGKVNDYIISTPSELVTASALRECSLRMFPKGTVLIGIVGQGTTRGTSARLAIDSLINQNVAGIIPSEKILSEFLHQYLIQAYDEVRNQGQGSNQEALNCQILSSFKIAFPAINEQQAIVNFIASQSEKLNESIDLQFQQIEKLKEYKTTLIDSAVSGKIKVPELME